MASSKADSGNEKLGVKLENMEILLLCPILLESEFRQAWRRLRISTVYVVLPIVKCHH